MFYLKVHVGIRGTVNSKEDVLMDKKNVVSADLIQCFVMKKRMFHRELTERIQKLIENNSKSNKFDNALILQLHKIVDKIGDNRVYISLDIDDKKDLENQKNCELSAEETGTPECGGIKFSSPVPQDTHSNDSITNKIKRILLRILHYLYY